MPLDGNEASDSRESGVWWGSIPRHSTLARLGMAGRPAARLGAVGPGEVRQGNMPRKTTGESPAFQAGTSGFDSRPGYQRGESGRVVAGYGKARSGTVGRDVAGRVAARSGMALAGRDLARLVMVWRGTVHAPVVKW